MSVKPKIYLDACCFIEIIKNDAIPSNKGDRSNEVWFLRKLLQANRDGVVECYTSTLSIAECIHDGDKVAPIPDQTKKNFESLLNSGQYLTLIEASIFVVEDARDFSWKYGLTRIKGADGVHLASALTVGATEFLSFDGKLTRAQENAQFFAERGLSLIEPSSTAVLPDGYTQLDSFEDN